MNRARDAADEEGPRLREVNVLRGQPAASQDSAQFSCFTALLLPPPGVPDAGTDSAGWVPGVVAREEGDPVLGLGDGAGSGRKR